MRCDCTYLELQLPAVKVQLKVSQTSSHNNSTESPSVLCVQVTDESVSEITTKITT